MNNSWDTDWAQSETNIASSKKVTEISSLLIRTRKEINIYYHNIVNGGSYNLALKNTQYNGQGRFQVSKLNTEVI